MCVGTLGYEVRKLAHIKRPIAVVHNHLLPDAGRLVNTADECLIHYYHSFAMRYSNG